MGGWWKGGRHSRRSPRRLLGHLLELRYGAAEGVLGAVALVLVVWMLWPEGGEPRLDQRSAWQESVKEAGKQKAEAAAGETVDAPGPVEEAPSGVRDQRRIVDKIEERPRRRIARPSELADRLDEFGRRPGALAANRSFAPAPKRPSTTNDPAIGLEPTIQAEAPLPVEEVGDLSGAETVQAALKEVVGNLQTDDAGDETFSLDGQPLDVAVLSTEALDAEPLPEVDLSDLDSLIPLDSKSSAPVDPLPPPESTESPQPAELDAAVQPFAVESDPAADVKKRPRDESPTWLKNAVSAAVPDERPIIAVVIDDLGLNRPNTAALNTLPAPLTLAFLPYAGRIEAQTHAARAAGHELMLHLPMEPLGAAWPGPDALTTKIDLQEFTARLNKNLSRFDGFVGINNHMGSRLTADRSRMEVVMRELRERDVLFLDSKTSSRSVASEIAAGNGVPNTSRDIFLDHVINLDTIKRQLARVETVARSSGSAVAIGHPHGATIKALREWLPSLEARGFALAPISAVVARRACNSGVLIAAETCGRYLQARTPDASALAAKDG